MKSKAGLQVLAVVVVFLVGLMACTTSPTRVESAIEECYPLLIKLTPYKHTGVKFYVDKGTDRSIYVEKMVREKHGMTNLPSYVLVPFTEIEFQQYVKARATIFKAKDVQYTHYGDKSTYVVIARIIQPKILGQFDPVITTEDTFLAQSIRHGNPCGVWEAGPK